MYFFIFILFFFNFLFFFGFSELLRRVREFVFTPLFLLYSFILPLLLYSTLVVPDIYSGFIRYVSVCAYVYMYACICNFRQFHTTHSPYNSLLRAPMHLFHCFAFILLIHFLLSYRTLYSPLLLLSVATKYSRAIAQIANNCGFRVRIVGDTKQLHTYTHIHTHMHIHKSMPVSSVICLILMLLETSNFYAI